MILDYTQQAVVARQHIDGVWHNSEARDRESGDVMLAVMKTLANLNANERRKKQEGKFGAKYKDQSFICPIIEPRRADRRARRACNCWAASSGRSRNTKTWACGRSWPSSGPR